MAVRIPKIMGHIWIGPKPMPKDWMRSWPEMHPSWEYRIYDNDFLMRFPFRTRKLIHEYFSRGEYAGVQDLMRYEILYEYGGFMADADAICQHPVDELLTEKCAYTVYDRAEEAGRGVSPFLASDPGNPLLGEVIRRLCTLEPWQLRKPFHSTGNLFLMRVINELGHDKLTIWPNHYFVPWHHSKPEERYDGPDTIYAEQMWGTATYGYNTAEVAGDGNVMSRQQLGERAAELRAEMLAKYQPDLTSADERPDDPKRIAADAEISIWGALLKDEGWIAQLRDMNEHLLQALEAKGKPAVVNANGFYRNKQEHRLTESPFMSRTHGLRARMACYLSGAKSVMQIGVDAGHALLMQMSLVPDARVVAFDTCTQLIRRSADNDVYTPAVMEWFAKHFPDKIQFLSGRPARVIENFRKGNRRRRFDLLHINGVDANFLKSYGAAIEALGDDGIILIQHPDALPVKQAVEQLQLIGEVGIPIEMQDFGPRGGGLAVLRRLPAQARAEIFSINN